MLAPANSIPASKSCYADGFVGEGLMSESVDKLPLSVLVVEDELHDFLTAKRKLERLACYNATIDRASSVVEARSKCISKSYDVALIDMRLGRDTGIRVLCDFKEVSSNTALILLSSISNSEMKDCALRAGAVHCIEKDVCTPEILETTIQCALHACRLERDLSEAKLKLEDALHQRTQNLSGLGGQLQSTLTELGSDCKSLAASNSLQFDDATRTAITNLTDKAEAAISAAKDIAVYELIANHLDTAAFEICDLNYLVDQVIESKRLENLDNHRKVERVSSAVSLPVRCQNAALAKALLTAVDLATLDLPAGGGVSLVTRREGEVALVEVSALSPPLDTSQNSDADGVTSNLSSSADIMSAQEIVSRHGGTWTASEDPALPRKVIVSVPLSIAVVN